MTLNELKTILETSNIPIHIIKAIKIKSLPFGVIFPIGNNDEHADNSVYNRKKQIQFSVFHNIEYDLTSIENILDNAGFIYDYRPFYDNNEQIMHSVYEFEI